MSINEGPAMPRSDKADNASVIADLGRQATSQIIGDNDRTFLVAHRDMAVKEITDPHGQITTRPHHVVDTARLNDPRSLIDYLDRYKTLDTLAFADAEKAMVVAIMDFHSPSAIGTADVPADSAPVAANFGQHRAILALAFSEEWKAWNGIDDQMMPQLDFARFIEEHAEDITNPSGAELLEVCRHLQATRKASFNNVVRTATGHQNFQYSEETSAGAVTRNGDLDVPEGFDLRIPVYEGHAAWNLRAYLRWNVVDRSLMLGTHLRRKTIVRNQAFATIVQDITATTLTPIVMGQAPGRG